MIRSPRRHRRTAPIPWLTAAWAREYRAGRSVRDIGHSYCQNHVTVWYALRDAGVKMRPPGVYPRRRQNGYLRRKVTP